MSSQCLSAYRIVTAINANIHPNGFFSVLPHHRGFFPFPGKTNFELDARPLSIPRFDSEDLSSTTRKKYVTACTYPRDCVHGAVSDGIFNAGEENLQHTGLIFETGNCVL